MRSVTREISAMQQEKDTEVEAGHNKAWQQMYKHPQIKREGRKSNDIKKD